jgi:poly(A) polymerase
MAVALSRAVAALQAGVPTGYFVGGCVRDWLMDRPLKDLDVAVPVPGPAATNRDEESLHVQDPVLRQWRQVIEQAGRATVELLGGSFFWLREGMAVGRIAFRDAAELQIDLVPLAGSLEADLRRRDFTINAMALPVGDGFSDRHEVIDPTGGRADLASRRLRLASADALAQDPLRSLRAFRFRAALGFTLDIATEAAIRAAAPGLARVSGERIRDELFTLLEGDHGAAVMAELLEHDLVAPWSPALANSAARRDADGGDEPSGLEMVSGLDLWLRVQAPQFPFRLDLEAALGERVTPPRSRRALTRLAALAIHTGARVGALSRNLALSRNEGRALRRAVEGAWALRPEWPAPGRARLRFWQQWEPGAVEAILLNIARASVEGEGEVDQAGRHARSGEQAEDSSARELPELLHDMLERRRCPLPPLLKGEEIMACLGVRPGPEVGRFIQEIEELRADGQLGSLEEARVWLRERRIE